MVFGTASGGVAPLGPQSLSGTILGGPTPQLAAVFWRASLLTYRPWQAARGDFDANGATDLVVQDALGAVAIWFMAGDVGVTQPGALPPGALIIGPR